MIKGATTEGGTREVGTREVGTREVGTREVGIREVGTREVAFREVEPIGYDIKEVDISEVGKANRTADNCLASCDGADTVPCHRGILQTINGGILSIELCLEFEDHLCEILDAKHSAVVILSRGRERGAERQASE